MAKLTLNNLSSLQNEASALAALNANFDAIEAAMEKTLSRDGTSPNTMSFVFDVNGQRIVNLSEPSVSTDAATKSYVDQVAGAGVEGPAGTNGTNGTDGTDGEDGWAPVLAIESDGDRRVLNVIDWVSGTGTKPSTGYVGPVGLVASIGDAVDIRGAQGTSGPGSGDLLAANNLSDVSSTATARTNLGLAIGTNVQAFDTGLAALALFNTDGIIVQTANNTYAGRTLTGTSNQITVTNGTGVSGNPTLSLPSDVLIPTIITIPNTGLHILDTNGTHDLIIAPGSNITADRTLTVTTGDNNRTLDISAASVTISTAGAALVDDADAAAQRTTLSAAARTQTEMFSIVVPVVENKNIDVIIQSSYALTITKIKTVAASGTCTVTGKIASSYGGSYTNLGGTANSASSTLTSRTHSTANSLAANGSFRLTITSNSSCTDLTIQVEATRTLD